MTVTPEPVIHRSPTLDLMAYGGDLLAVNVRQAFPFSLPERGRMRILMVTDFYHPYVGGVEQHVRTLAATLATRGHDVAVATLVNGGLPRRDVDGAVRVYRLHGTAQRLDWLFRHSHRPWAAPMPDPEITLQLRRVIASERPDVVHGHDWLARSFLPLKPTSGSKLVMSLHYFTRDCAKKNLMYDGRPCEGPAVMKCLRCASRHYGAIKGVPTTLGNWASCAAEKRLVDMFLPVSQFTAEHNGLIHEGLPFQVIPNFVVDQPTPHDDIDAYTAQLPGGAFTLFVGDFRRDKGFDVLLAAYAGIADAPPLVLIGKRWDETPKEFPSNVMVLGEWPNAAVMEAWRRCLFGIVPSVWPEPFGIVLLEAMAAGRPVVASRGGGIPDIVVDGVTGLLTPPGDITSLRDAIVTLLHDQPRRSAMQVAAKQRSHEFMASSVVPRIEHVYEQLIG
jgi:glycosyltransferase involved in cell wall biosynthesis